MYLSSHQLPLITLTNNLLTYKLCCAACRHQILFACLGHRCTFHYCWSKSELQRYSYHWSRWQSCCLPHGYKALHSVLDSTERVNSSCGIGKHMLTMYWASPVHFVMWHHGVEAWSSMEMQDSPMWWLIWQSNSWQPLARKKTRAVERRSFWDRFQDLS